MVLAILWIQFYNLVAYSLKDPTETIALKYEYNNMYTIIYTLYKKFEYIILYI